MKLILFLLFCLLALWLVYRRARPYLRMAQQVYGAVQSMKEASTRVPPQSQSANTRKRSGEKLVRCFKCGTWLPASRALTSGSAAKVFCSPTCSENPQSRRASVS